MNSLPFRILLYRYFFFSWLFKDVDGDNVFERAAAQRHNREQARWLPTYIMRWLWLGLGLYALGALSELAFESAGLSVLLYGLSGISVAFTITIATAWLGIKGTHRFQ